MNNLSGKVAIVTGASRGVGKGIALGLAEQGATVYVTGRTESDTPEMPPFFKGTNIHQTAKEINELGGKGIAVRCDHSNDDNVTALFQQIKKEQGKLDILVNNAWSGAEHVMQPYFWNTPFWEQPTELFDDFYTVGLRSCYTASKQAVRLLITQKNPIIVNISFYSASRYWLGITHGVFKAATDKLTSDMAHELKEAGVAVFSLYPGSVRTEGMIAAAGGKIPGNSESPLFVGRCVSVLAKDESIIAQTGSILRTADIAIKYGITDLDGTIPQPPELDNNS